MTFIKNVGRQNLHFVTGAKNGEPVIEELLIGESKNIDIDRENSQVTSRVNSRQIVLGRAAASAAKPLGRANRVENPNPSEPSGTESS